MNLIKSLYLFGALPMLLASCNDGCSGSSDKTAPSNNATWQLDNQTYNSTNVFVQDNNYIHAEGDQNNGIIIHFKSMPTTDGRSYTIVNFNKAQLDDFEIGVEVDHGSNDVWLSTGNDLKTATAVSEDGKLHIRSYAPLSIQHFNGNGPQSDSTKSSFDVSIP